MIKISSSITQRDLTYPLYDVGSVTYQKSGSGFWGEYVYLPGTTSVEAYDGVTIGSATGSVTRLAASAVGRVAVAQAAITSNYYGWYQVKGAGWIQCGTTSASGSICYASGTTGAIQTLASGYDAIQGLYTVGAGTGTANGTVKVQLNYPFIGQRIT